MVGERAVRNQAPELRGLTARIGRVWEEGRGWRQGGLQLRFGICDDGPQNSGRRWALVEIRHRWRNEAGATRTRSERQPLITYDIYFAKRQCLRKIGAISLVPSRLDSLSCYEVGLRVRDPAGKWSQRVDRAVQPCDRPPPTQPVAVCSDGLDNDADGHVDHPNDPDCQSPSDADESTPAAASPPPSAGPPAPSPPPAPSGNCDPSYPTVCIPSPPPDRDCADVPHTNFAVLPPDPHNFDGNHDGVGCEL
jgi:hypothetical protein